MARHAFNPDELYPARVLSVRRRPLENRDAKIALLRIVFELFQIEVQPPRLVSRGELASRDLVITRHSPFDAGVGRLFAALNIARPDLPQEWERSEGRWVQLTFDEANPEDERNPLGEISAFSPDGYAVEELGVKLGGVMGTIKQAAKCLGVSESTARRLVDRHAAEWGDRLVEYSAGGRRRINLLLVRHIGDEQTDKAENELVLLNKIRALRAENVKLESQLAAANRRGNSR